MRFYHSLTLSTLILIYLLSDNVLGAPMKGRYMWLKCKPDSKNANCLENKGPQIDLPGQPQRLSSKSVKDIDPVESSEESSEAEESGDGSGDLLPFDLPELSRKERNSGQEEELQQIQNEAEGSGAEVNHSNYIAPEAVKPKLSAEELRKDNMIE